MKSYKIYVRVNIDEIKGAIEYFLIKFNKYLPHNRFIIKEYLHTFKRN